jgi:SPX domain protein involved in polyphosphate accumulation
MGFEKNLSLRLTRKVYFFHKKAEWELAYLNYKKLKELVHEIRNTSDIHSEEKLYTLFEEELEKVNTFFKQQETICTERSEEIRKSQLHFQV